MPATSNRIDPLYNDVFLRVFGQEDSKEITGSLVNSILREANVPELESIESIYASQSEMGDYVSCRVGEMDIFIITENRYIDLEVHKYTEDVANKMLFYAARTLSTRTRKGTEFNELPQVVAIMLLDAKSPVTGPRDVVTLGSLRWNTTGELATDRIQLVLVDMREARKRYNNDKGLIHRNEMFAWLYTLMDGYQDTEGMDVVMTDMPTIEEFAKRYNKATSDPEVIWRYQKLEDRDRERHSFERWLKRQEQEAIDRGLSKGLKEGEELGLKAGKEAGFKIGVEQGIEQGLEQERNRAIEFMRNNGFDEEMIRKFQEES